MTSPVDVMNDTQGVSANGDPLMYRLVKGRYPRNIGDIVNDPTRQHWGQTHNGKAYVGTFDTGDHSVLSAEQLTGVHAYSDGITRDVGDVLIELMEFAIEWRTAYGHPTSAKGKAVAPVAAPVAAPALAPPA